MYNPFLESERIQKIGLQLQVLYGKRLKIVMDLMEQNYYNSDSTHLFYPNPTTQI